MFRQLKYSVILCLLLAGNSLQSALAANQNAASPSSITNTNPSSMPAVKNLSRVYDEASMLRADNKRLKGLINNLNIRIADLQNNKRFCSDQHTSATKSGVRQECYPYNCDQVTGACLITAHDSYDCVQGQGLLWDNGKCVHAGH